MKKQELISIIITLLIGVLYYYIILPPLNFQSLSFYSFIFTLIFVYTITYITLNLGTKIEIFINRVRKDTKIINTRVKVLGIILFSLFPIIFITNIIFSPLFFSDSYANRIVITDSVFTEDVEEVNFNQLPLLDKDSSTKLGDRVMGQMPEMVSQYYVSDLYTQINYNEEILRVTPLEYNGLFKWLNNKEKGITGYITVNSVDGNSKLVKLEDGMKYMESAYFSHDLDRYLRFNYPTSIFGTKSFEIDNEGNPYWIVPIMKYSGIGLKQEVKGVIILDPITGNSKKYDVDEVPSWVDHVYNADLIIEQVDDWGLYKEGFINSLFSQTNVVMTTEGYNYTVMNDDVYLYTGITSVSSDEANIGFILTNMRTKETKYYAVPGAEEYSAMSSAEGQVQQMNYTATFPLLINLNNKPTYLMSLKDNAGLVKMYAFVDVENYQKVVVTDASLGIEKAKENYLKTEDLEVTDKTLNKEITIFNISEVIIDGNTFYYITDNENKKYSISIKANKEKLPFIKKGDKIKIYYKEESEVTEVIKVD